MAKIALIDRLFKAMAEHHCEATNQQMVTKTIKIGKEVHLPAVKKKTRLVSELCRVAADVYCEEHGLELTSAQ